MSLGEEVVEDYVSMRLTLRAHPMAFLRHKLTPGFAPIDPSTDADASPRTHRRLSDAKGIMRTDVWGEVGDPIRNRHSARS